MGGEICNRTENGYGTGIEYGYCTIRTAGLNQGTEVRNVCSRFYIEYYCYYYYHVNRINIVSVIERHINIYYIYIFMWAGCRLDLCPICLRGSQTFFRSGTLVPIAGDGKSAG